MNHLTRLAACLVLRIVHSICAGPSTTGEVGTHVQTTFQFAFQL
jgi:hypothetical protein